jgi:hypothetical protein
MICAKDGKFMTKQECDKKKSKMESDMRLAMARPGVKEDLQMKRPAGLKRQTDGDMLLHNYGY